MSTLPDRMHPAVAITPATTDDIGEVQRLASEVWHRHYPGIITVEQIDYMLGVGYSRDALAKFLSEANAGLALARRDATPVGFVAWRPDDGGAMKLERLYVLPQHHGEGIGRALIEHVASHARAARCSSIRLNVNRGNAKAIAAYERCGFAIRERGDFPIGNGFVMEDFIMVRDL